MNLQQSIIWAWGVSQLREAGEQSRAAKARRYAEGAEWECLNCGLLPAEEVRQEERDETCLYVCRRCGAVVDEPIPF